MHDSCLCKWLCCLSPIQKNCQENSLSYNPINTIMTVLYYIHFFNYWAILLLIYMLINNMSEYPHMFLIEFKAFMQVILKSFTNITRFLSTSLGQNLVCVNLVLKWNGLDSFLRYYGRWRNCSAAWRLTSINIKFRYVQKFHFIHRIVSFSLYIFTFYIFPI